jgi:hypothetical protein
MVAGRVVSSKRLAVLLKNVNLDVSCVDLDQAVEFYEKARQLEWKRVSYPESYAQKLFEYSPNTASYIFFVCWAILSQSYFS